MRPDAGHRIFTTSVASVYPLYRAKIEKKGRTRDELDAVICWLTGYHEAELDRHLAEAEGSRRRRSRGQGRRLLIAGTGCCGYDLYAAMSSAASGSLIVVPATQEDFLCAA
jgi:hypothetical protein